MLPESCMKRPTSISAGRRTGTNRKLPAVDDREDRMAIVAGVDFGTLSVRVSIVDSGKGRLGTATADFPLFRTKDDPDHATQRHQDHMRALVVAMKEALAAAEVDGATVAAIALDTTGSSVVPVDEHLN